MWSAKLGLSGQSPGESGQQRDEGRTPCPLAAVADSPCTASVLDDVWIRHPEWDIDSPRRACREHGVAFKLIYAGTRVASIQEGSNQPVIREAMRRALAGSVGLAGRRCPQWPDGRCTPAVPCSVCPAGCSVVTRCEWPGMTFRDR